MTAPEGELKIVESLLALPELEGISDSALLDLVHHTRLETYPAATVLYPTEHNERRLYLLRGSIELKVEGKTIQVIEAQSKRAATPLFLLHTPGLAAICHDTVEFLSVDDKVFEHYVASIKPAGSDMRVAEYQRATDEPELVTEVNLDFIHANVDLPSMPDIACRIFEILQRDDMDIRQVADVIKLDPIISVRIVQVANSALYHSTVAVESIKDAISRIGINATRAIVMSVVLKNLFYAKSETIHKLFQLFYHHSIRVAAIAHTLAGHLDAFNPDEALLAGLIHDIGAVPILVEADHNERFSHDESRLISILQQQAAVVGAALLKQWGFEPVFVSVARDVKNWQRQVATADYCDLIQIAQLHCHLVGGRKIEAPPIHEIPAFTRLELEKIEPQKIIHESRHEIHEIVNLLIST